MWLFSLQSEFAFFETEIRLDDHSDSQPFVCKAEHADCQNFVCRADCTDCQPFVCRADCTYYQHFACRADCTDCQHFVLHTKPERTFLLKSVSIITIKSHKAESTPTSTN